MEFEAFVVFAVGTSATMIARLKLNYFASGSVAFFKLVTALKHVVPPIR